MLGDFIEYCHSQQIVNVEDITKRTVKSYLRDSANRGNKPNTINTKILRIKAFFNHLVKEKIISESPVDGIKRQTADVQIEVFTDEQINQMLRYYRRIKHRDKAYFAYRDYTMIVLLLGCGARRGEVVNIKWQHVDLVNRTISLVGKNRTLETIPITQKLVDELLNYKEFCEQYFNILSDYVFVSRNNKQMTVNAVSHVFKNLNEVMNFKNVRVSAHTFRHSYAHRLAISGISTFAIQKLMRHKTLDVTAKYVAMWGNELRDANDKFNPLNNLDI